MASTGSSDAVSEKTCATDVAIVGGGLAGLACAIALQGSGLSVTLFEAGDRLGGRARSWIERVSGDAIDVGPHIILSEYRNMLRLLDQLGSAQRIVWQTEQLIRLIEGGHPTDMHLHALPPPLHLMPTLAKVRGLSVSDKLSNLRALWLAMQIDERTVGRLDRISAAQLLRRQGVSRRFIDWFWASACIAIMNVPLERCSAGALMRVISQMTGRRNYRIGFAGCALGELFVPGARRVIENAGGSIHMKAPVCRIVGDGLRATGIVLHDGTRVSARYYVAAVPPCELERMLPQQWRHMRPFGALAAFEPCPYISSYLWFDRKLSNQKFWMRVWNPRDLNSDFYDLSNIRPEWQARPSVLASNIIYSHRAHEMSDAEIIEGTLREAREALPAAADAQLRHAVVNRIPMAIECPLPGTEARRPTTLTPVEHLLLAGDWTRTHLPASMESAVRSGYSAAEEIWSAIGKPRQLALPLKPVEGLAGWVNRLPRCTPAHLRSAKQAGASREFFRSAAVPRR